MVEFLNDVAVFKDGVTVEGPLLASGGLTVGPGGAAVGDDTDSWPGFVRVRVADAAERTAVKQWRDVNDPITTSNPLFVWRANGALGGLNEMTLNGTDWYSEGPSAGDVEMTIATSAPVGWLLMQGQLLANAAVDYPTLWAAASPALREGGSLRIPDMRGRVPMGAGTGTGLTLRNLGDKIGAEAVAITEAQLASHTHLQNAHNHIQNPHRHTPANRSFFGVYNSTTSMETIGAIGGEGWAILQTTGSTAGESATDYTTPTNQAATATNQPAGGNEAHPNVQPSLVLNFKVKI